MTVMRMKVAAAPLLQNVEINTRKKRERRKRKKKKRRRRKRGSINHLNPMRSQNLTAVSCCMFLDPYLWTARKDPKNEEETTRKGFIKNSEHTDGYTQHPTLDVPLLPLCRAAARKKRAALNNTQSTISLCCKTCAKGRLSWSNQASALLPVSMSRKQWLPRYCQQICRISRLSIEVSFLHEVIWLYTKPHCNGTAVCTMQSTESSLTVLLL